MILTIRPISYEDLMKGKGKAADEGAVHTWKDGKSRRKVGKKWVLVSNVSDFKEKVLSESETYYNYAMTTNMGDVVEYALNDMGISTYDELVDHLKGGPSDTAHQIYKKIVDTVTEYPGTHTDKQAAIHLIGTALVRLRDTLSGPKTKLTIKKTSPKGKDYYAYSSESGPPTLKASAISAAKRKVGGWTVTGPIGTDNVRKMLKNKNATLVSGKIDSRRKWEMLKGSKGLQFKYGGDSLNVTMIQMRNAGKLRRETARVSINIPYAFVHAFLNSHTNKKTRNNYIHMIERSKGYREFLKREGA